MSLTGHLMDKANIVSHGADHVDQGVLLHLDRRVRDEDEGVEGGSISWQHVVDLWVHSWWEEENLNLCFSYFEFKVIFYMYISGKLYTFEETSCEGKCDIMSMVHD